MYLTINWLSQDHFSGYLELIQYTLFSNKEIEPLCEVLPLKLRWVSLLSQIHFGSKRDHCEQLSTIELFAGSGLQSSSDSIISPDSIIDLSCPCEQPCVGIHYGVRCRIEQSSIAILCTDLALYIPLQPVFIYLLYSFLPTSGDTNPAEGQLCL